MPPPHARPQVVSARKAVLALNSALDCRAYEFAFDPESGLPLVAAYDLVLDASDNPRTR